MKTAATKLSRLSVPIQATESQSGNDREKTTSPPGHHWEEKIALTTTAELQQPRANSREMATFAELCSDPRNATTVKWQVRI